MAWTARMQAVSFAVSMGVTLGEFVIFGIPIAALVWMAGLGSAREVVIVSAVAALLWSLSISIYGHFWQTRRVPNGAAGTQEAK